MKDDDDVEETPLPLRLKGIWAVHEAGRPPQTVGEEIPWDALREMGWAPGSAELQAWRQSGWRLVRPDKEALAAHHHDLILRERAVLAPVYLSAGGPLWLTAGQVLVEAPEEWSRAEIAYRLEAAGLALGHAFAGSDRIVAATHPQELDPVALCKRLTEEHDFARAEPEFLTAPVPAWRPNDPEYDQQWSWRNTGQGTPAGSPGADVSAERAWRISRGAGAIVAVIDEGFDTEHEDLAAGVHANSGHFDSISGSTWFHRTTASSPGANHWHGTMCAGRAAARGNNRRQGCGMAPEADLLLIAMNSLVSVPNMVRAIEYAANPTLEDSSLHPTDGADVISCSLKPWFVTGYLGRILIQYGLRYAGKRGRGGRGCFIAWAAPNSAQSVDSNPIYRSKYVSVVAMTDRNDLVRKSGGVVTQGTGTRLTFVAPGNSVFSTAPGSSQLVDDTGCSFATPVVAGLAALCCAVDPHLTRIGVEKCIRYGCEKVGAEPYVGGRNNVYGYGRVNAGATISKLQTDLGLGPWP